MPLDNRWMEADIVDLSGEDRAVALLAIVLAKASYRVTDQMVADVLDDARDEERFIRILAWSSSMAARRFAQVVASRIEASRRPGLQVVAA